MTGGPNYLNRSLKKILRKHFILLPVKQADDFEFAKNFMIFFFGKVKK